MFAEYNIKYEFNPYPRPRPRPPSLLPPPPREEKPPLPPEGVRPPPLLKLIEFDKSKTKCINCKYYDFIAISLSHQKGGDKEIKVPAFIFLPFQRISFFFTKKKLKNKTIISDWRLEIRELRFDGFMD